MKRIAVLLWALIMFSFAFAQNTVLSIEVSGILVNKGGAVEIAIYKEQGFLNRGMEVAQKIVDVENENIKIRFTGVKPGTYAVAVFQDYNVDSKINKNSFGVPIEPYGFSNNNSRIMGSPKFKDVSFRLGKGQKLSVKIDLD